MSLQDVPSSVYLFVAFDLMISMISSFLSSISDFFVVTAIRLNLGKPVWVGKPAWGSWFLISHSVTCPSSVSAAQPLSGFAFPLRRLLVSDAALSVLSVTFLVSSNILVGRLL